MNLSYAQRIFETGLKAISIVFGVRSGFRHVKAERLLPVKCNCQTAAQHCRVHPGVNCESLPYYVQRKCCLEFNEVKHIYDRVHNLLNQHLVPARLNNFEINHLLFCGSLSEGTRIKDPRDKRVTVEFDILAVSNYYGNHTNTDAFIELKTFLDSVMQYSGAKYFFKTVPAEGDYVNLQFTENTGYTVLVDLHPAVTTAENVFVIPLNSFWRKSHVIKEIATLQSTRRHHILSFRILKVVRLLMNPYTVFSKYALKTAVLIHILDCDKEGWVCDEKSCVQHVLQILHNGYRTGKLSNPFSGQNAIERHDRNPTTVLEIKKMTVLLNQYFQCVCCLFLETNHSFLATLQ